MHRNMLGGAFILTLIGLLFLGVLVFRELPGGLGFDIQFDTASGLEAGDFVYLAGVRVGEVRSVGLREGRVVASVTIDSGLEANLTNDSYFFIWWDQLVTGKKCITIRPGESGEPVAHGAVVQGDSSVPKILRVVGPDWIREIFSDAAESW